MNQKFMQNNLDFAILRELIGDNSECRKHDKHWFNQTHFYSMMNLSYILETKIQKTQENIGENNQ